MHIVAVVPRVSKYRYETNAATWVDNLIRAAAISNPRFNCLVIRPENGESKCLAALPGFTPSGGFDLPEGLRLRALHEEQRIALQEELAQRANTSARVPLTGPPRATHGEFQSSVGNIVVTTTLTYGEPCDQHGEGLLQLTFSYRDTK